MDLLCPASLSVLSPVVLPFRCDEDDDHVGAAERTSFHRLPPISSGRPCRNIAEWTDAPVSRSFYSLAFLFSDHLSFSLQVVANSDLYRILRRLIRWRKLDEIARRISDGRTNRQRLYNDDVWDSVPLSEPRQSTDSIFLRFFTVAPHRDHRWIVNDHEDSRKWRNEKIPDPLLVLAPPHSSSSPDPSRIDVAHFSFSRPPSALLAHDPLQIRR